MYILQMWEGLFSPTRTALFAPVPPAAPPAAGSSSPATPESSTHGPDDSERQTHRGSARPRAPRSTDWFRSPAAGGPARAVSPAGPSRPSPDAADGPRDRPAASLSRLGRAATGPTG